MSINTIKERIENREELLKIEKIAYINYAITTPDKAGKLNGISSISTSCIENETCLKRHENENFVCYTCYAFSELMRKKALREKLHYNTIFFAEYELSKEDIPYISASIFRLEGFGEIKTMMQVKNYFTICRANKHCDFVLWAKNSNIIDQAMKHYHIRKPKNLRIIASEKKINPSMEDIQKTLKEYSFVSKVFAVMEEKYAAENGFEFSCMGNCIQCMKCYQAGNEYKIIIEKHKKGSRHVNIK